MDLRYWTLRSLRIAHLVLNLDLDVGTGIAVADHGMRTGRQVLASHNWNVA